MCASISFTFYPVIDNPPQSLELRCWMRKAGGLLTAVLSGLCFTWAHLIRADSGPDWTSDPAWLIGSGIRFTGSKTPPGTLEALCIFCISFFLCFIEIYIFELALAQCFPLHQTVHNKVGGVGGWESTFLWEFKRLKRASKGRPRRIGEKDFFFCKKQHLYCLMDLCILL